MAKFHRINQYIKADSVRAIGPDGAQLGVMSLAEALAKAKDLGVDVVEVAETAKPPVVKLIEFSKFKYQENKKERAGLAGAQETKQIILKPFMAENDLQIKLNRIKKILSDGDKVRLVVKFKGREITKKEFGDKIMARALEILAPVATIEQEPKMLGKLIIAQLKPKK
ncbi:MAG: translation initiation factor IF-3 [Microgenomates group bacterium]